MTTIDQQITEQFGKIIKKFPILHHGWELDGSGGDEYVVQQFTELYDKNKKPIYDGDIIRRMFNMGPAGEVFQTAPVEWNSVNGYRWNYWNLDTVEVFGNIFQNPELLKQ